MSISEKLEAIPFDNEFDNSKPFFSTSHNQSNEPQPPKKSDNPFQFLTRKSWYYANLLSNQKGQLQPSFFDL